MRATGARKTRGRTPSGPTPHHLELSSSALELVLQASVEVPAHEVIGRVSIREERVVQPWRRLVAHVPHAQRQGGGAGGRYQTVRRQQVHRELRSYAVRRKRL